MKIASIFVTLFCSALLVSWVSGCQTEPIDTNKKTAKVIRNEPFYASGPQQGRAPDGNLPPGSVVTIVGPRVGDYVKIRTSSGVEAYIHSAGLQQ